MKDSDNKRSRGFLTNAFGVAKKLSEVGIEVIQQATSNDISKQNLALDKSNVIEGSARTKSMFEANIYENPQQLLRTHVPQVSRQLFGKHYGTIDRVANFVAPQFSDKVSDYLFDQLNTFTNNISSVDAVLDEAGVQHLEELTRDVSRSERISRALAEQNKWIASVQGAVTGATGVIGSAVDIPVSIVMSLRTIYQVGRSYGFELNKETEQEIVQYIFKQIDLGLIAEKQAILMAIKAISNTLETHDVHQLQKLVGSSNDIEALKRWLTNEEGDAKWQWLNSIPKFSMLTKLAPIASASVGAMYSWKLVEEVNEKAQIVFAQARAYLLEQKDSALSPLEAYEKSLALVTQIKPKLIEQIKANVDASVKDIEEVGLKNKDELAGESVTQTPIKKVATRKTPQNKAIGSEGSAVDVKKRAPVKTAQQRKRPVVSQPTAKAAKEKR
ncbi:EcsC family protein [Acinetobacter portensis]|uniref:EcsC family protein n=2 Tax=Acinetobacter TaxID=469 RepID=A0A6L6GDS4_9GAMM|nr:MULTISPECIES: EcsC family protein [Acinetobacter]MCK7609041.1 EcsC family protein [Acinetobacter portensis]MCK7639820.1 EcsC family protein [Acinetobacter portensis]MDY6459001.1 EcsC family protein [Acinetobacter faecalis]MDY6461413.1 EcsC family protein [Acinetobacter faecalis]MDY6485158.1 EcsC family protein [Acinetobacter faecalis]